MTSKRSPNEGVKLWWYYNYKVPPGYIDINNLLIKYITEEITKRFFQDNKNLSSSKKRKVFIVNCVYMKQKKDRKARKKGIVYCMTYSEDKNTKTDCKNCKKYQDRNKYFK